MKKNRNKKMIALTAAALVLSAGAAADKAMAYFTVYTEASGGQELNLGFTTTVPDETVSDWTKEITLTNTGENDSFVRVKALAGSRYGLEYTDASQGGWSAGADGYYYWQEVLAPGETTGVLQVKIDHSQAQDDFNVIVIQECTPVICDENGSPLSWDQIDWSRQADVVKQESLQTVTGGEDGQ